MTDDIQVHLIDDDEAMRDSMGFLLESADLSCRTYSTARAFLEVAETLTQGCVVSDVRMPEMSGLQLVKEVRAREFGLPVIMITGHGDVALAVEAMKAGVADFIEKPFDDEALLSSIKRVLAGDAGASAAREAAANFTTLLAALSPRENEVLEGVVAGKINKVIAYDLGISPRTVEVYRANVMSKMGATSLSELVRMSILAGV